MKVLVTGREGQLARSLVERARIHPWLTVEAVGRPLLDLETAATILSAIEAACPDVVINAAAYTAVDQAEDEPDRAFAINGAAAGLVATAARASGAKVIQISTDYVFDGQADGPYAPDDAPSPIGVYGRSKLEGEERVRDANPDHLIVRTAWVYSPFGKNFVRTMLGAAATRDNLSVVADQSGNPTSALDIADGLLAAIATWRRDERAGLGRTYHLAGTGSATWYEFARALFDEARAVGAPFAEVTPIKTADWPTRAVRPANSQLDSTAFAAEFGHEMPLWRDSIRTTVRRLCEPGIGTRPAA